MTKNLDKQTTSEMDTIGSYFVNLYCFEHKVAAKNLAATKNVSVTSAYHTTVTMYVRSLSDDKYYKQAIMLFHEYSNKHRSQMTFATVEDRLVSKFIPAEYYEHFSNSRREQTLREIFMSTARHLADWFIQHTDDVLEEQSREMIREYQEMAIVHLKMLRDGYYTKFAKEIIGARGETVDADQYKKLSAELLAEKKTRMKLEVDLVRAQHIIRGLTLAAENFAREAMECKQMLVATRTTTFAPAGASTPAPAISPVVAQAVYTPQTSHTPEKAPADISDWCEEVKEDPPAEEKPHSIQVDPTPEPNTVEKVYAWGDDEPESGW